MKQKTVSWMFALAALCVSHSALAEKIVNIEAQCFAFFKCRQSRVCLQANVVFSCHAFQTFSY